MSLPKEIALWHDRRIWRVDNRLTKKQARQILEGKAPDLGYPMKGQHPWLWQKGDRIPFSPELEIEILNVTARSGRWHVNYLIRDHRPRLLGRQTGYTDNPGRAIGVRDAGYIPELEAVPAPEKTDQELTLEDETLRRPKRMRQPKRPGRRERAMRKKAA